MNENLKDGTTRATARRRLIRGAFAAPAALTLYSGSVAAASITCVAKQLNNAITTPPSPPDSTLVRVPLYRLTNGTNSATFVRQAEIGSLTPPGGSYLTVVGQAQCVSITNTGLGFSPPNLYINPTGPGGAVPILTSPVEYVAVRVDVNGAIDGVLSLDVAGTNTALHKSCWTSFGGLAPFN